MGIQEQLTDLGANLTVENDTLTLDAPLKLTTGLAGFLSPTEGDVEREFKELPSYFPPGLFDLSGVTLTNFAFKADSLIAMGLEWESDVPWSPIGEFNLFQFEIKNIALTLRKDMAVMDGRIQTAVTGKLTISGVEIEVRLSYPDYTIDFSVDPGPGKTMRDFIDSLKISIPSLDIFPIDTALLNVGVQRLALFADGRAKMLTFDLALGDLRTQGTGESAAFQLDDLALRINYLAGADDDETSGTESATGGQEISAAVSGTFSLGTTNFEVGAEYDDETWHFSGRMLEENQSSPSTGEDENNTSGIPLGKWLGRFVAFLPSGFKVPDEINELNASNFEIDFTLAKEDGAGKYKLDRLTFACEVTLPIGTQETEAIITIEKSDDGLEFTGYVSIGGIFFDLTFASEAASQRVIVASYQADGVVGPSVGLKEYFAPFLPEPVAILIPELEVTLNSALLAYQNTPGAESSVLFVLNMGGGDIDRLGELPVIGEYLAEYKLSIDYQVTLASEDLKNDKIRTINDALQDGFKLPEAPDDNQTAIRHGFNLLATVDLGGGPLQLTSGNGNGASPGLTSETLPASGDQASNPDSSIAPGPSDEVNWVPLQRSVGPLYFSRIGFQYKDTRLTFLLDASINIAVLTFSLQGLSISSPLENFEPELGLTGFGLSYRSGPLEITGEFLRQEDEFIGVATIKAQTFSLTAFGSYSETSETPSMFLYALLDKELGGPAFFYVTGLALGFGYNRDIRLPSVSNVANFPLVAAARKQPDGTSDGLTATTVMLDELNQKQLIPAKIGAYWIAAGVRFSSFQFIESFALLLVKFGNELEFLLMGLSTLRLPKPPPTGTAPDPYLYVEMQFMVSVKPQEGVFRAEAQLTDNSYLIDPGSKLSGGFAFYSWFKDIKDESGKVIINGGDFVLTVGGYHPNFKVPAHYPQRQNVAPVTINWPLPQYNLSIKGTAYFAMTPSCIMAGGTLEAIYDTELIWASFTARANFLISWEPFYYDVDLNIMVHVRVTLDPPGVKEVREALNDLLAAAAELIGVEPPKLGPITIVTSVSAGLHLWGPPFAGTAHIQWETISFDVKFGAPQTHGHRLLNWSEFQAAFLPANNQSICQVSLGGGLVRELENKEWLVDPETLAFTTSTFIPATQIILNGSIRLDGKEIGFRSMGSGRVESIHTITISKDGGSGVWVFEGRSQGVPAEIWDPINNGKGPSPSATLLPDRLVGTSQLRPEERQAPDPEKHATNELELSTFKSDPLPDKDLPQGDSTAVVTVDSGIPESSFDLFDLIVSTAMDDEVQSRRRAVLAAARTTGFPLNEDIGDLGILVESVATSFQSPPMVGNLGSPGSRDQRFSRARKLKELEVSGPPPSPRQAAVRLTASLYQYRYISMLAVDNAIGLHQEDVKKAVRKVSIGGIGGHLIKPASNLVDQEILREAGTGELQVPMLDKHNLNVGQSQVWQLTQADPENPVKTDLEISNLNGRRLRIVSLDRYSLPLNDEILSGSEDDQLQLHVLHPQAAQILVTGLPGQSDTSGPVKTIGWYGGSALIQMQPRIFVGDRALVQAQASRQRVTTGQSGVGLVGGMAIVDQNLRVDPQGNLTRGWLRTYLRVSGDHPIQTLAVAVRRSVRRSSLAPQPQLNIVVKISQKELSHVFVIGESEAESVLLYSLEDLGIETDGYLEILTESTTDWVVDGVMGIHAPWDRVSVNWAGYQLREAVAQTEGAAEQTKDAAAQTKDAAAQEPAKVRIVAA